MLRCRVEDQDEDQARFCYARCTLSIYSGQVAFSLAKRLAPCLWGARRAIYECARQSLGKISKSNDWICGGRDFVDPLMPRSAFYDSHVTRRNECNARYRHVTTHSFIFRRRKKWAADSGHVPAFSAFQHFRRNVPRASSQVSGLMFKLFCSSPVHI